jgi:arylsulfatase A-like enzyme
MRRVVVVILDGLRRDFIDAARTPNLHRFAARSTSFAAHRSAFPSATRCVSATFATGCHPARHGLQGNAMALLEAGVLVPHDAGLPGFLQHKRAVNGQALAEPTLAERLAPHGGAVIFSNVSPGAAYAHDPDGFGHLHHRAGSFAPGRVPAGRLEVTLDAAGDRAMTERCIAEALMPKAPGARRPALALLWCAEPDHIQHDQPLGSPEHLAVLAEADRNAAAVIEAVDALRQDGDEVLLIVGSDHGHETVSGLIDVEGDLIAAGLKSGRESTDIVAQSNGTSTLIYLAPERAALRPALDAFLRSRDWAGRVLGADELASVGQAPHNALAFAVSMRANAAPNQYGIPGSALAAMPRTAEAHPVGAGQHGGLAAFEQSPFLMIDGDGFSPGTMRAEPTHIVDLAPTILTHLRLPAIGMDGSALQYPPPAAAQVAAFTHRRTIA